MSRHWDVAYCRCFGDNLVFYIIWNDWRFIQKKDMARSLIGPFIVFVFKLNATEAILLFLEMFQDKEEETEEEARLVNFVTRIAAACVLSRLQVGTSTEQNAHAPDFGISCLTYV